MQESRYGIGVDIALPHDAAIEQTTAALGQEGFGVLSTIDLLRTMKQKLDREIRKYVILGACNPALAGRALDAELEIGLLLPCNVIVYEREPGISTVAAMAPLPAMGLVGNADIEAVARDADARLRRALTHLERTHPVARR